MGEEGARFTLGLGSSSDTTAQLLSTSSHMPFLMHAQVLTYGHRKPVEEFVGAIQSLTAKDLSAAVAKLLATPPSMATLGDTTAVPRYDTVAKRFG
jgi:predicted Zn-dependent peptidase